jgi:DNA-binding CsgD family transcriptional regulator
MAPCNMRTLIEDSRQAVKILEDLSGAAYGSLGPEQKTLLRRVAVDLLSVCRAPVRMSRTAEVPRPGLLTGRETEVAGWIAKGLTDAEIAGTLGISTRTVNTHRDNLLRKLNLRSRSAVASWIAERISPQAGSKSLA